MKVKFSTLNHAKTLGTALIKKSDINTDGAIRDGDIQKLAGQIGKNKVMGELTAILNPLRKYAQKHGGPSKANVTKALNESISRLKARDKNGNDALEDNEQPKSMTVMEASVLRFATKTKSKKVSDFKFPKSYDGRPKFNYSGTPAKVCQSLLDAFSKSSNDSFWPSWAVPDGQPRAARYVIDGTEARAMVGALKKLYVNRQRAILTELAGRTSASVYGCASPTNAGKTVFEAYAQQLGLELTFGQPGAPGFHIS